MFSGGNAQSAVAALPFRRLFCREMEAFDRAIDIRILRIRRKIEVDPKRPTSIRTVRSAGYMFVPPED